MTSSDPRTTPRVVTLNWRIHTSVLFVIGLGWLAIVYTHPDRSGLSGLGDGILVFLTGAMALGYAVLTSLAMLVAASKRHGALIVHGAMLLGVVAALAAMVTIH